MNPSRFAQLTGTHKNTVRRWTNIYAPFLSPSAAPATGRARSLQGHDQRVLLYVATMRDQGLDQEAITQRLSEMQANEWDGLPTVPPEWQDTGKSVPVELAAARASEMATVAALQTELQHTRQALQEARQQVELLQQDLEALRGAKADSDATRHDLELRLSDAKGNVSRLEARLQAYTLGRSDPVAPAVLIIVTAAVVVVAVLLVFVVARLVM